MNKLLSAIAMTGCSFGLFASEAPKQAPATPESSGIGYYTTTCGKVIERKPSSAFTSMSDWVHYMQALNDTHCGKYAMPDYSTEPPKPNTETPGN